MPASCWITAEIIIALGANQYSTSHAKCSAASALCWNYGVSLPNTGCNRVRKGSSLISDGSLLTYHILLSSQFLRCATLLLLTMSLTATVEVTQRCCVLVNVVLLCNGIASLPSCYLKYKWLHNHHPPCDASMLVYQAVKSIMQFACWLSQGKLMVNHSFPVFYML